MNVVDQALATQLANIEKRTGKKLTELADVVRGSGLAKHGEIRDMLKTKLGMGHGDANTLVHYVRQLDEGAGVKPGGDPLDNIYAGPKAALRPIHDKLMAAIRKFGDFEESPKKTYISLRRKKQFAMLGPATNTRVEVGLNIRGLKPSDRLLAMPEKSMCQFKVNITDIKGVDAELIAWIRSAFDAAE